MRRNESQKIPCLGRWTDTTEGREFDCDYEHSGGFGCDDCASNGGRMDPRTGKALKQSKKKTQ